MKLQFKNQAFQEVASAAVRDVFEWRRGRGPRHVRLWRLLAAWQCGTVDRGGRLFAKVLILFGQCSMAAWVITQFFASSLTDAANCFVRGIPRLIGTDAYQPIFVAVARAALLVWLLWQWRRLRSCRSAKENLPSRL